ncbi:MAG: ferritin family protein [Thermoplasmata archaeon]|nr:ferritin family protein [Thermoplasmata archaeon]
MAEIRQVLATAIEFEKFGVVYYTRFEELLGDPKAKALMRGLAHDESEHEALLAEELARLGGKAVEPSKEMLERGLAEIFPEVGHSVAISTEGTVAALKAGIQTEERSIEFYSKGAEVAEPAVKELFLKLEKMEREHRAMLEENLRSLESDNSWYGYVPILEG